MSSLKVMVIGGGAAGFFAAINCALNNKNNSITILEKTNKLLTKVRISGGGRCNLTHACFDNKLLVKNYPRGEKELHNVFSKFTTTDTVNWFEQRGVKLKIEDDGRMFPESDSSETIVNCLIREADAAGVKIKQRVDIEQIIKNEDTSFTLKTNNGGTFVCDKLIIATGGNSKESAYEWIQKLGHTIIKPFPSLFTYNIPNNPITQLMGVSVPHAKIKVVGTKLETEGPLLITHWGMSGPAILKSSALGARILNEMNYNFTSLINWLPRYTEEKLRIEFNECKEEFASKTIINNSPIDLPKRLWEYLVNKSGIQESARWADLPKKNTNILINSLLNDEYKVQGKTTFKDEFVTSGGINLKEIDFATMESKIISGLYFAGEILNIDGITGGFNFQNAWSTAWIASKLESKIKLQN